MKRVVAEVPWRFKVMLATVEQGVDLEFLTYLTSKMKSGFLVKIVERGENVVVIIF